MGNNLKESLRKRLLTLLRIQKEDVRLKKSKLIENKLFKTPEFMRAQVVMFYFSFDGEVETLSMIEKAQKLGKKVALPITIKKEKKIIPSLIDSIEKDLTKGPYGIQQPKHSIAKGFVPVHPDLVIVPGVGFDQANNRLGRGEGYYDRFLSMLPKTTPIFGLAFDFQIVSCLPSIEKHDIPVSRILTN
ncbi:MAG: 5-formyltetrahydrofolate cyclo-ligase [Candidatus Omnitrophica bacterium]|nr:5-formyltetrahydrofolate cyclo-ligase [Candidatus Omnitrophota bacterium]